MEGISNFNTMQNIQDSLSSALDDYCTTSNTPEKFNKLLLKLPDIKMVGHNLKELLKALDEQVYNNTLLEGCLLSEMLYGPQITS